MELGGVCLHGDFEQAVQPAQVGNSDMLAADHIFAAEPQDACHSVTWFFRKARCRDVAVGFDIAFVLTCYQQNASGTEALAADDE